MQAAAADRQHTHFQPLLRFAHTPTPKLIQPIGLLTALLDKTAIQHPNVVVLGWINKLEIKSQPIETLTKSAPKREFVEAGIPGQVLKGGSSLPAEYGLKRFNDKVPLPFANTRNFGHYY